MQIYRRIKIKLQREREKNEMKIWRGNTLSNLISTHSETIYYRRQVLLSTFSPLAQGERERERERLRERERRENLSS